MVHKLSVWTNSLTDEISEHYYHLIVFCSSPPNLEAIHLIMKLIMFCA